MERQYEKRKKMVYQFICDDFYVPMKMKEMASVLQVKKEERQELKEILDALESEGKIHKTQKGNYVKGQGNRLTGIYQAHARGFGFVSIEGSDDDVFIPEEESGGALQGDEVEIQITRGAGPKTGQRQEGKVIKILKRGMSRIVGYYQKNKSFGFVLPDNQKFLQDVFVPEEKSKGAVTGHKVVVKLTSYGGDGKKPEGEVVEILGHVNDPGTDVLSIAMSYELPIEFPEKVMNQAERVAKPVSEADRFGRRDLRDVRMVTIDGEDAKDLDDAVSLEVRDGSFYLGVHIADVTNYVQENSALYREAKKRGTSVYLADRVIPMLPHTLSNGICSLNAGEDRLALSCLMKIDENGTIVDHEICESVIRVDRRMTYTAVKQILEDEDEEQCRKYEEFIPMFREMARLSSILREKRHRRGAVDFDFPETKVILDEQGRPVELKAYERNTATKLIEDFMLAANETVAEDFFWREIPFVYRIHEAPDEEKIRKLAIFLHNFGYTMHIGNHEVHPKEIQKLLAKVEGKPEEPMIARLALRSMKQAKYTPENEGHFGLAASCYTHFTSPIRRYPDLQIHRIIKENLRGKMTEAKIRHYQEILDEVARQSSAMERRAEEAERETIKMKKAEYMESQIGEIFEGVISGVTDWGLYVELPNTVEGLVHVNSLMDDYYVYDSVHYTLTGERKKRSFAIGQKVKVRVAQADARERTVDFVLAD